MNRLAPAFALLALAPAAMLWRLGRLQLVDSAQYREARDRQTRSFVPMAARRGSIWSIDGRLLATGADVPSIYADPAAIEDLDAAAEWAAARAGGDAAEWRRKLAEPRRFVWIVRHDAREPGPMPKGFGVITEVRRVYPQGAAGSALVGFTDIDGVGREGVERAYDALLAERARRAEVIVDALRRPVWIDPGWAARRDGHDIRLTLNLEMQLALDDAVRDAAAGHAPRSISAVAIDAETGAIRALSTFPAFDPNRPGASPPEARLNRVLTDPFEPGSTIKPLIVARALERGVTTISTVYDCAGTARVGPRTIHCHKTHGPITTEDVIVKSCNVGAARIAVALGERELQALFSELGFGAPTGVDLPIESRGRVTPADRWSAYTTSSAGVGYEVSVTPLQLAVAHATLANGGRRVRPHVVAEVLDAPARVRAEPTRVFSEPAARILEEWMVRVVERGTAQKAAVEGLRVGGKTGTTQKLDPATGRYGAGHIATFVGHAGGLVVVFCVDDPQGEYYGGTVAAPSVGNFFERIRDSIAPSVLESRSAR